MTDQEKKDVHTSLENTYREGIVDGIKMGKESSTKNNNLTAQSPSFAVGIIVGLILGFAF